MPAFKVAVLLSACLLVAPAASAARLFEATATNGAVTISSADSSFLDMIESVVERTDEFAVFAGTPVESSITYLGVPSAVTISQDFSGRNARVRIDRIGFDRTFTGTDSADVRRQIEKFLKTEGSAIIARFRKAIAFESAASVTDGNPSATTAVAAGAIFFSQGFTPLPDAFSGARAESSFGDLSLAMSRGSLEIGIAGRTYHGEQVRAGGSLASLRVNDRVRIELPVTAEYTEIEGTEIFGAGATLAMPVTLAAPSETHRWTWRIVPVFGLQTRASFDAVAGGLSWHTGLVNSLDRRLGTRFVLSAVTQATTHQGFPINIRGYTLDFDINQTILKNGVRLGSLLAPGVSAGLYVVDTRFLHEAAVDQYYTTGLSLDFRRAQHAGLGVGVESDRADDYRSLTGRMQLNWTW